MSDPFAALFWRARRVVGKKLVIVPALSGVGLLILTSVALTFPGILTPSTRAALEESAGSVLGVDSTPEGLALSLLVVQGPYLMAMFASMVAVSQASDLLVADVESGGFEQLLAAPIERRQLVAASMGVALCISVIGWLVMTAVVLGGAIAILNVTAQTSISLGWDYWVAALWVPLPLMLFATVIGAIVTLRLPRLARLRIGLAGNVTQLVALAPALTLFMLVNFVPDLPIVTVAVAATVGSVTVAAIAAAGLAQTMRTAALLETS